MTEQDFLTKYCKMMNEAQLKAIRSVNGPVLLLAVPGSGKTTVLVHRLGYMVCSKEIDPRKILTMTYTVAATQEMKSRFIALFGAAYGEQMEFRTINGLSQKILMFYAKVSGKQLFALQEDQHFINRILRQIYQTICEEYPTDSAISEIRTAIAYCKNMMLDDTEIKKAMKRIEHFPEIYAAYRQAMVEQRWMDYDDQMQYAYTVLKSYPKILAYFQDQYQYLCVDEAQDTSKIQHEIIRLLASKTNNLFMVGDEDQSIYGFRAAYPDALMEFRETYPGAQILLMEDNYRSAEPILQLANEFVAQNKFRHPKKIQCNCGAGEPLQIIEAENRAAEYKYLFAVAQNCKEETAMLYRNNDSAVPLIDLLERNQISYNCRQFDETFFSHRVIMDVEDIIRFSADPADTDRFQRIFYKLSGRITKPIVTEACRRSERKGTPVLNELLNTEGLNRYARDHVTGLIDAFAALPHDSASLALNRIRKDMGYGEYLLEHELDGGKLDILDMLSVPLSSGEELLNRLAELREIIRNHRNSSQNNLKLSTIHSSKGLEYENVYLVDILDGILPCILPNSVRTPEDERTYQEERRLFYVAVTRAKRKLLMFDCKDSESTFIREALNSTPRQHFDKNDYLAFLSTSALGKTYEDRVWGKGRIIAQNHDRMLISFSDNTGRIMTVSEMLANYKINCVAPQAKKKEKQKNRKIAVGTKLFHPTFGKGTVESCDGDCVTVRFETGKPRKLSKSFLLTNDGVRIF